MKVYYNEIDERAAAWLRALITAGVLPDGEVDTRSIEDVTAADLAGFRHCHFFAGIGGWAYALQLAGWPVDREVWTGSCPCQPWSVAGAGEGIHDRRHLWPAWQRLIEERRPATVFGEQTAGEDGLYWLDLVFAALEAIDYAVGAVDLPAAGAGAPHGRQRLWFVADNIGDGCGVQPAARLHDHGESEHDALRCGADVDVADTARRGQRADGCAPRHGRHADQRDSTGGMADTGGDGTRQHARVVSGDEGQHDERAAHGGDTPIAGSAAGGMVYAEAERPARRARGRQPARRRIEHTSRLVDTERAGLEGHAGHGDDGDQPGWFGAEPDRPAAAAGPTSGVWFPCDWIPCIDGRARPVEPGTFPLAHGLSARVGRLRGYGNAIVPQVAAEVIGAYLEVRP